MNPTTEVPIPPADAELLAMLKPSTLPPEQAPSVQAVQETAKKILRLLPANSQRTRALQLLVEAADAAKRSVLQGGVVA